MMNEENKEASMDSFEKRLRSQAMRRVPPEWREEILGAARTGAPSAHISRTTHHDFLSSIRQTLVALLWPHPKAWAGLAAAWLLVMASNYYEAETVFTVSQAPSVPASPELIMAIKQQRRELARLVDPTLPTLDAERPRATPSGPRSQRRAVLIAV
jgi:hypothetical protein